MRNWLLAFLTFALWFTAGTWYFYPDLHRVWTRWRKKAQAARAERNG